MPITYGDAGTNRTIRSVTYCDAGTNRTIRAIYYGDAGTNRLVFAAINLLGLNPLSVTLSPADASATYSLTSAGQEQATGFSSNTWLTAGVGSDYEVFATLNSGALSSGTTGSWLSLGSNRSWNVTRTSDIAGVNSANLTIQVRLASSGAVLASVGVVITAQVDL